MNFLKFSFLIFAVFMASCYHCPGDVKEQEYIGVVINKFRKKNHNVPYIQIERKNGTDTAFDIVSYSGKNNKDLYESIHVGDSVYKPKGKFSMEVWYKATNTKEVFDFWCYGDLYSDGHD